MPVSGKFVAAIANLLALINFNTFKNFGPYVIVNIALQSILNFAVTQ